jgi:HlyD family secretion protein
MILLFIMLLAPVIAFSMRARQAAHAAQQTSPTADFTIHVVERGRVESVVSAIGTIEADQVVALGLMSAGRVREVLVEPGQYVFAGETLLTLEDDGPRIAYEQALLALDRAQLELDNVLAPVSEDDIRIAQANLDSAWGSYLSAQNAVSPDDIRAAELAVEQAEAALEVAQSRPGAFGGNNLENAQAGAASFNAEIARLQLEQLQTASGPGANAAYARVIQAQRELERVQAGPTDAQIDSAALAVAQAEAALRRAETALNRTILTAPIEGVVSALTTEVGALVAPGLTLIELTDVSPLRLTVAVDEIDIRLVEPGLPVRVRLDALPGVDVPARVERVGVLGNNVEGVVSYDVVLTLEDPDQRARVGMTAEAGIVVEARDDVLYAPNEYVRVDRRTGQAFVQIISAGDLGQPALTEIAVVLGLQGQARSEIVSGLDAGQEIAIDETSGLTLLGD